MNPGAMIALGALILGFGLVSKRLQTGFVTPPMVFVAFGLLVCPQAFGLLDIEAGESTVHTFAELTLILVLFSDAARIDLRVLRREYHLPLRLLGIGMPLTLVFGTVTALWLFESFTFFEAALLAAILTPTDAALGQAVVSDPAVPGRIRQTLNVESGLNDGIALPAVLMLAALATVVTPDASNGAPGTSYWLGFTAKQLILGPVVGIFVGYFGGKIVELASRAAWMNHSFQMLSGLALALLAFACAEELGGNGFIAAFVAGLTIGNTSRAVCECLYDFTETEGQLLVLITFLLFGAVLVLPAMDVFSLEVALYAVLSLTAVRMLAVAISLAGARLRPATTLFLGWFGPRGLASILFALIIMEGSAIAGREQIMAVVVATVLLSVLTHGLTAAPLARAYGRVIGRRAKDGLEEHVDVTAMPLRIAPPDG